MKKFEKLSAIIVGISLITGLAACGSAEANSNASTAVSDTVESTTSSETAKDTASDVTVIKVAFCTDLYPTAYYDEDGNVTGSDIEILKRIDEELEQYEFTYEMVSFEAEYTGLSSGVYDIALSNAYWTEARAEKYIIPDNPIGANIVSLVRNVAYEDVTTFRQVSELGLSIVPNNAANGMWRVYDGYNEQNPDALIEVTPDDGTAATTAYADIALGKYDVVCAEKFAYESLVVAEDGAFHEYADKLIASDYTSVFTYPIIAKADTELAEAINEKLGEYYDEGYLQEIAESYLGYDSFAYTEGVAAELK